MTPPGRRARVVQRLLANPLFSPAQRFLHLWGQNASKDSDRLCMDSGTVKKCIIFDVSAGMLVFLARVLFLSLNACWLRKRAFRFWFSFLISSGQTMVGNVRGLRLERCFLTNAYSVFLKIYLPPKHRISVPILLCSALLWAPNASDFPFFLRSPSMTVIFWMHSSHNSSYAQAALCHGNLSQIAEFANWIKLIKLNFANLLVQKMVHHCNFFGCQLVFPKFQTRPTTHPKPKPQFSCSTFPSGTSLILP